MFNYGNANEAQKEAISATDGLVLITAGPGTGKTFTLVKRAVYLIQECGIKPEQIMMATFTEKAAKELITRITNELAERNVSVNVNEMYIGTFHSLCLRIIKENLEFTRLKRNYRLLDTFDQKYLVFRNFHKFKNIEGIDELLSKGGSWKRSDEICTYINHLSEEMVDIEALQSDDNPGIRTLGRVLSVYQEMLEEGNLIDFSTIQTECYKLLMQNKQILEELQDKLQYLMIDEYQDTNYIQEQIVFLLGAKHHNICVVGDDDQGLYRFRGATIRNILEFPHKFENEGCKIIPLVVNYRSNSDIVDFYNEWISTTSGHKFKFSWDIYRYQKKIEPHVKSDIQSPAVVKLFSKDDEDDYIIDGKIDLVKGVDGTVEIVDFKSERKPDMVKMRERLEHYRRQLQIYAYLIEQRTGQKVSKMHLYYTGEENGNPMITYPYTRTAIEGTVAAFDDTVHKILRKDFKHRCDDAKTCKNCDFRYYCNK